MKLDKILSRCVPDGECLIWTGALNSDGYPRAGIDGDSNIKLHRYVCAMTHDINGLVVRHTCDNIRCLNPLHLVPGTVADNIRDMDIRGRRHRTFTKELANKVYHLIQDGHTNLEIEMLTGINSRRISEVRTGKRDINGSYVKR